MADINKLKPFILKWEGGFVNDPADLGGATNKGVTLKTYKDYCERKGKAVPTVEDLKNLSDEEMDGHPAYLLLGQMEGGRDREPVHRQYPRGLGMGIGQI